MKRNRDTRVLVVGLGLMGGSYAMALRRQGLHVSAISDRQDAIDFALERRIIDEGWAYVEENAVRDADIVVFALYPHVFLHWIRTYGHLLHKDQLITDVTGVKQAVVYEVQRTLGDRAEFIASHPMAGREVYGVENSTDGIFRGANFLVVPTEKNTEKAVSGCRALGELLGFERISVLSPGEHDRMIAFLSQLPHCIAVSLMCCSDNRELVRYTGDSFRDLTRIARINEDMWSELFLLNKEELLGQMDAFLRDFTRLRDMLAAEDGEGMKAKMRLSTLRRGWFDKK